MAPSSLAARSLSRLIVIAFALVAPVLNGCGQDERTLSECVPPGACDDIVLDPTHVLFSASGGNAELGAALYTTHCVKCHGEDGVGKDAARGLSFQEPAWQKKMTDNQVRLVIQRGRGERMPAFALSEQEIRSIISHLRSLVRGAGAGGRKYGL